MKGVTNLLEFTKWQYHYQNDTYTSGFIFDFWACSQTGKDKNGNGFPGAYPNGFLNRLKDAFIEVWPEDPRAKLGGVLHLCAGRVPKSEGWTLDIKGKYRPDYKMDAQNMPMVPRNKFAWCVIDWPYNEKVAKEWYNTPMLKKGLVFKNAVAVTQKGGFIGILDHDTQQYRPPNVKRIAMICVTNIPDIRPRLFTVYRKLKQ